MKELIFETKNFKLYQCEAIDLFPKHFEIFIKYSDLEEKICDIFSSEKRGTKEISDFPSILTKGANLQNCITTWELYKEFIMLVDIAYDEVKELNK